MQAPPSLTEARAELLARVYGQLLAWRTERLTQAAQSTALVSADKLPALDSIPRAETPPEEGLPHES
jgi:hypothetical protein